MQEINWLKDSGPTVVVVGLFIGYLWKRDKLLTEAITRLHDRLDKVFVNCPMSKKEEK